MAAGFVGFEITWQADVFAGAPQHTSAANFGTLGITFRARKPVNETEWRAVVDTLVYTYAPQVKRKGDPMSIFQANAFYDAGDKGCGEGPLDEVAALMRRLAPGQTLEVRAQEPSVATDLPAWCRLAGYELAAHQGDHFLIRRT